VVGFAEAVVGERLDDAAVAGRALALQVKCIPNCNGRLSCARSGYVDFQIVFDAAVHATKLPSGQPDWAITTGMLALFDDIQGCEQSDQAKSMILQQPPALVLLTTPECLVYNEIVAVIGQRRNSLAHARHHRLEALTVEMVIEGRPPSSPGVNRRPSFEPSNLAGTMSIK